MRLLDTLLGRISDRAVYDGSGIEGVMMQMFARPDRERILPTYQNALQAYSDSGVVFGVLQARLSLFTEATFKFQVLSDKSLFGNASLALLENPWPNGTTGELLARMEQDASLAGNAYIRKVNDELLERLRPDQVTIVSKLTLDPLNETEIREVVGYWFEPATTDPREPAFYPVEEIVHWSPIPDPSANFRGMSWLTPVLRDVVADEQMTDYKRAYLTNAATPNMIIKYPTQMKQENLVRLKEQIHARHGGVKNAFQTMVLDEGADPMILGNNFEQMAFQAVQSAGENRIAVAAGVPAIVAGLSEGLDSNAYGIYGQAMRRFTDLTMRPNWRSACAALAKLVEVPVGTRLWFDVEDVAALRQGEKDSADTMMVLAQAAQALVNAGYDPDSIATALSASDVNLLKHTGMVSVQLQTPGAPMPAPMGGTT